MNTRSTDEGRKTDWYPPTIKPARVGVYERQMGSFSMGGRYSYWNGEFWCGWGGTVLIAEQNGNCGHISAVQSAPWRGFVKPQ